MAKKNSNNFTAGDYIALGLLAFGEVCKTVADSEQTVFVPRGTNIGFSNPTAAKEYAEKYLGSTQIVASPLSVHMISETRTPGIYGDTVVRYYSDGSKETITPGIFGSTTRRTGGCGYSQATVVRSVATPIDRQSRRPSTLDGGRVYQSLTDWEWR